jgi:hypothetical protein
MNDFKMVAAFFRATVCLSLVAANARAGVQLFTNSTASFSNSVNDEVFWNAYASAGAPNPLSAVSTNGLALAVSQPSEHANISEAGNDLAFPPTEYVLDNEERGDVTIVFNQPVYGFGVFLEDAFGDPNDGFGFYAETATTILDPGGYGHSVTAGNALSFLGVLDTVPEISKIVITNSQNYFYVGTLELVSVPNPVLVAVPGSPGNYTLNWPTNATGLHVQYATNLSKSISWQALGGNVATNGAFFNQSTTNAAGSTLYFRLSNGTP